MKTDREKLIDLFNNFSFCFTEEEYYSGKATNEQGIEQLADYLISKGVTIPVRCGECKEYNTFNCSEGFGWCERRQQGVSDDHYCSLGERKEE